MAIPSYTAELKTLPFHHQVQLSQPRGSEPHVALDSHVQALWHDQIPICIEVRDCEL